MKALAFFGRSVLSRREAATLAAVWVLSCHGAAAPLSERTADAAPGLVSAAAGWSDGFALVPLGGELRALLGQREGEVTRRGPLRLADRDRDIVYAAIPHEALPEAARTWRARAVEVVTDRGERCRARVRAFDYRVDLVPDAYEADRVAAASDGERAQRIWRRAYGRTITAQLVYEERRACVGEPLYARDLARPRARVARKLHTVPRADAVLAAFRSLSTYREIQEQYERGGPDHRPRTAADPVRWERYDREPNVEAFAFDGAPDVLVSVSVPWAGCSAWDPALWAVFRVDPEARGAPRVVHRSTTIAPNAVELILRADGELDYVVEEGFPAGRSVIRGQARLASWAPEFHGCGC